VPAPPELRHRLRDVGRVEILLEAKSQQARQPDRHVGITGKIEIDLQRETAQREPGLPGAEAGGVGGECLVDEAAERIGDQQLAAHSARKAQKSGRKIAPPDCGGEAI